MTTEIKENKQSIGISGGSVPAVGINVPIARQFQNLSDSRENLIKSPDGFFWCYTHLETLPLAKQSMDPRYCQWCYEIQVKELADLKEAGDRHKHWWAVQDRRHGNDRIVLVQEQPTHPHDVSVTTGNCLFCGAELTKRRKSKLFCNATCRVRYSRQQKAVTA
jgi:hypothetical protein